MYLGRPDHLSELGVGRVLSEPLRDRLGDAEVDNLWDPFIVLRRDQDVGRLDVAMDDALLVCVLHTLANVDEQLQPIADCEPMLVAVLRDGNPLYVLHREVRAALRRRPRVVDARDVRMIHQSQGLSLRIETGQDFLGVHAPLDQLERDPPANGHLLLRLVDDAHAAFADFPQDAVGTNAPRAVAACRRRRLGKGRAVAVVRAVFGHCVLTRDPRW